MQQKENQIFLILSNGANAIEERLKLKNKSLIVLLTKSKVCFHPKGFNFGDFF